MLKTLLLIAALADAASLPTVGGRWVAQGPGPILFGELEGITDRPVVGAINAVVAHPSNADILWVGTVNGGIWKTTNATSAIPTWTLQTDAAGSLSISTLERDPTDGTNNTLVAGTGNTSAWGVSGSQGRLLRTVDGGANWSELAPTALAALQVSGIAPRGSIIVASVASCGPIYRSTDAGASFALVPGLPKGSALDLSGDPTNNAVLYAAITECSGGTTLSGVYKSTDTGASWTRVSNSRMNTQLNGAANAELAVGASGQVYVAIVNGSGDLAGLFRSGDGGSTWIQLDTPATTENGTLYGIHPGHQGALHLSLAADPLDVNLVYIGGDRQPLDQFPSALGAFKADGRLFRVNAGALPGSQVTSLTHCRTATAACNGSVSTNSNSAPHADSRAMVFTANGALVETDDGGIYRRTVPSGTGDWFSLNGNLQITEIHDVVYDRVSKMIMSGNQDNGTPEQTAVGGTAWTSIGLGDGGDVSVDDMTSSAQSTRYSSSQYLSGFLRRTVNGSGMTTSSINPALTVIGGGAFFQGQFATPVELNRIDPRRILFLGNNDLYESLDRGDTIAALRFNKFVRAAAYGGKSGGVDNLDIIYAISHLGADNTFKPTVYIRTAGSGAPVPTATQPTTDFLRDIAVDITDWQKAYVVTQTGTVFSTSNAGGSWTNITGNLPSGSTDLYTIVHIPGNPSVIAVGGANGVFSMATNNPGTWNQLGTGLSKALVYDMDYDPLDDVLVAGTLGRGAWKLTPVAETGPLPSMTVNDVSVPEGNSGLTTATFTVALSAAASHLIGIDYATANGTATGQSTTAANASRVNIQDAAIASPYPSSIVVSGVGDPIRRVTVTLNRFRHTFPDNVDVLLVGPGGQSVVLMSDAGGSIPVSAVDLTFDDAAANPLPDSDALLTGRYRPTNYEGSETFTVPAPSGPYGTALSAFNGTMANGSWSLYVLDDTGKDVGAIDGGWSLTLWSGDYAPTSGSLLFYPGTTSQSVNVPVFGDTLSEANETFFLNLSNPSNVIVKDSQGQGTITNDDGVAAPASVVATATTPTNVNITWTAVSGASSYNVYRSSGGGVYTQVGSTGATSLNDATASANTAYLYKVRSSAGIESPDSNIDLATTVIFTDPSLIAGSTLVRAVHFTELLTAVNAVRALAGLGPIAFTTPAPANGVRVLGAHMTELRNGLTPARTALSLPAQTFTDATITKGSTFIKAAHVEEVRNGVK